jgi:hypothetical protein
MRNLFPFGGGELREQVRGGGMDLEDLVLEDIWRIGLCRRYGRVFSTQMLSEEFDIKGLICGFFVALERVSGRTLLLDSALSPAGERWFYPI